MSWWGWVLVAVAVMASLLLAAGLWLRREWLAIPPAERRPWPEIRREGWAAIKATARDVPSLFRGLVADAAEDRAVRRRMDANARRARRELIEEERERVRQQFRAERRNDESYRRAFRDE